MKSLVSTLLEEQEDPEASGVEEFIKAAAASLYSGKHFGRDIFLSHII
jgi:hypothetical protein